MLYGPAFSHYLAQQLWTSCEIRVSKILSLISECVVSVAH